MRNIRNIISGFLAVVLAVTFAGCGKKPAPEPPLDEIKLVLQIYQDLGARRHEQAAAQISRLIAIQQENEFLYQLRSSELDNVYLERVQQLVAADKLDAALQCLKEAELQLGRNKRITDLSAELTMIDRIRRLVVAVEAPANGAAMEKDATQLKLLLEEYPPGQPYIPLVDQKIRLSQILQVREQQRALFSIYSDIARAGSRGDKDMAAVLTAVLLAAEPDQKTLDLADYVIQACNKNKK
ncbi:MAG: hypothetical protein PHQ27_02290 [Victivallales bacterium]|nr:hypothetical protein [Victivallales bacterium]